MHREQMSVIEDLLDLIGRQSVCYYSCFICVNSINY